MRYPISVDISVHFCGDVNDCIQPSIDLIMACIDVYWYLVYYDLYSFFFRVSRLSAECHLAVAVAVAKGLYTMYAAVCISNAENATPIRDCYTRPLATDIIHLAR